MHYQTSKQLNILPYVFRFDFKDLLFSHQVFYGISTVSFPYYLHKFTGSRLRRCHLDSLSMVSDILPKIPKIFRQILLETSVFLSLSSTEPASYGVSCHTIAPSPMELYNNDIVKKNTDES